MGTQLTRRPPDNMTTTSVTQTALTSIRLTWALFYANMRMQVFPLHFVYPDLTCSCEDPECRRVGKHPMTVNGLHAASLDPAVINNWWDGEPEANVGVRTGAESNIVGVDIDPRHDGHVSLARLEAEHGPLPVTPRISTGSGGEHILFLHPGRSVRNRQDMVAGIDVRGDGGYLVGAGSNHVNGIYTLKPGLGPHEVPLAPMPEWLLTLALGPTVNSSSVAAVPAAAGITATDGGEKLGKGSRRPILMSLAGVMHAKGMSRSAIEAALKAENLARCVPPLEEREVLKLVAGVSKYPAGSLPRGRQHSAAPREEVVRKVKEQFESAANPAVATEKVDFIVRGLVAQRAITLITGKPKLSGKSTLVAHMTAKIVQGHTFLGLNVEKSPVVILTEERTTFVELLRRSGLAGREDVRFLRWNPASEATFAEQMLAAKEVAKEIGAKVIVVDTLAQFIGLRGDAENDPGSALEGIKPLQDAATDGFAVVVVHHEKKSGGGVGDSSRGSTAFTGAVDVILSVTRPEGQTSTKVRVISSLSRYPATPESMFVELTDNGYERREEAGVLGAAAETVILAAAPEDEGAAMAVPTLIAGSNIKESTARKAANKLVADGKLCRKGDGRKGDPHVYWRGDSCRTTPSPTGATSSGESQPQACPVPHTTSSFT